MSTPEYPKAEPSVPAADTISIRVVSQDGGEILFRIKKETPLKRLMDAYCNRMATSPNAVRFLFDGKRIAGTETATLLQMEDRDIVDAVLQQVGGGGVF